MNKRTDLKEKFVLLQSKMISDANLSCAVDHPTDKGANSEKNWIQWFKDYLPKRYKAAKATVIDSRGNTSDQIDIVLYDAQYSYLAFNQNEIRNLVEIVTNFLQGLFKESKESRKQGFDARLYYNQKRNYF